EATEQVESLKTAIERLGSVNLGAIEELERLRERESFLRTQQEDLLEAKETLYQVIREMDEEMTKRFSEVFQEIQKDRKSTRLNSSHVSISYAVFCLKKQRHVLDGI